MIQANTSNLGFPLFVNFLEEQCRKIISSIQIIIY